MNALVTGGGGFIGRALVQKLVNKGFNVKSYSRGDYPDLRKIGVHTVRGDLSDANSLLKASKNIDVVFHIAAKCGITGNYREYFITNVTGTKNVISACKLMDIKYLIYTSSASVVFGGRNICGMDESIPYPDRARSSYTATKALAENLVLQANSLSLKTLALRPHLVFGYGDNHLLPRILYRARSGKLRRIGKGRNLVDVTYIDNVVDAHLSACKALVNNPEAPGKAYFITNGDPVLLWDFLNSILKLYQLEPVNNSIPVWTATIFSMITEAIHKTFLKKREPLLTRFLVKELSRSHWFDISKAKEYINYMPSVSNAEALIKMMEQLTP